ncbi:methyltransferase-like protein 22 [Cololabis saira]|uniref:methyltransferase-like protein 22 n=1 Tax=Cololabis saira TaxID=129043 RepID=UPI002AD403C7|nr:methyltransferase-like protein 22 [Cololabis saira]
MERIVFQHDTVLSDVHVHLPIARNLMTRLSSVGQPVFMSTFKILEQRHDSNDPEKSLSNDGNHADTERGEESSHGQDGKEVGEGHVEPFLDQDGDLDITHRPRKNPVDGAVRDLVCPVILRYSSALLEEDSHHQEDVCLQDVLRIEHTMATPLEDVGKQVWRGALFLSDFILSKADMFRGTTVLELGAGTGLTSIVMATTARAVYCTDVGEDLLSLSRRNVSLNKHVIGPEGGEVRVRRLDWLKHSLCTDADEEFSWTEEEVADLYDNTSFIIAADVCYDDDLTDGLFRTLYHLCSNFSHTCVIFISIEKRMNFTLQHMDVSCDAYNHFRRCLSQLQDLAGGGHRFSVEQVQPNFTQFLLYDRVEQLELWKVTATPVPSETTPSDPDPSDPDPSDPDPSDPDPSDPDPSDPDPSDPDPSDPAASGKV